MSQLEPFMTQGPLPPSRHRRSWLKVAVGLLTLLLAGAMIVSSVQFLRGSEVESEFVGEGQGEIVIVVERGDTLTEIGSTLADAGVVSSAESFINAASVDDRATGIGPGEYTLRQQMSGTAALELMLDPASRAESRLVLPEGLRLEQTVDASVEATGLPKGDFQTSLESPQDLGLPSWAKNRPEGFMFPATYDLAGDETAEALLRTFVKRFTQASNEVGLEERAAEVGLKPYKVLIVASLLQAEVAPSDFAKAARVIYNRLDQGMPLQLDSTVSYALGVTDIQLNSDQLGTSSPFNTYVNKGLPPRPINSPGEAALEAALDPAEGDWLYFVSVDPTTGETRFTADYDEFLEFKQQFQERLAELEQQAADE